MTALVNRDLGTISVLVNNAGVARPQKLEDITEEDWDEITAANLKSAFLVTQAALPGMRAQKWGRVINMSGRWRRKPAVSWDRTMQPRRLGCWA